MPLHIERGDFDVQRGRFRYFVCFTRDGVDDNDVRQRVPVEMSVSVSENGELADLSFQLPKACRPEQALALLKQDRRELLGDKACHRTGNYWRIGSTKSGSS